MRRSHAYERTRVDLGKRRATVDRPEGMVLYLKGRFLPVDTAGRDDQIAFDNKLLSSGAVSEDGRGPGFPELGSLLRQRRSERGAKT